MTRLLPPALAALLAAAPLQRLVEAEHPRSRQAREALAAGKPDSALEHYGALEKELGARPDVESGRGAALLGLSRGAEAAEAYGKAQEAPEPLGSRALLGLGNARAAQGDLEGAIAATREALRRDPGYGDARYDLEVLLRRKAEASGGAKQEPDQAPRPSQQGDPGSGGGADRQQGGARAGSEEEKKPGPGPQPERPEQGRAAGSPGEKRDEQGQAGGALAGGRLSREEAERLLDAMRARERNLPTDQARRRETRRPDAAKDW